MARLQNLSGPQISLVGDGSWGTAILKMLHTRHPYRVRWWVRDPKDVRYIKAHGRNPGYLSSVKLIKSRLKPSSKLSKVLKDTNYVFLTVPSAYLRESLAQIDPRELEGKIVISSIKGMMPKKDYLVSDFLELEYGVPRDKILMVSGPCHAEEVAMERNSYLTVAGNRQYAEQVAEMLRCDFVRVTVSDDLKGVEYSAVMKNIYAMACGITHGLNLGDNFQAVLVSNAMEEIKLLMGHLHPQFRDIEASAYLGDLLVTAYSPFSRNRTFGVMIGRGYSVASAKAEMKMVAEGYQATASIYRVAQREGVSLPICEAVYRILHEGARASEEIAGLLDKLK